MITKELSKTLFRFMGLNIFKQNPVRAKTAIQAQDSLDKLIQDYRRLITLSEPSEVEFQRLEEILEQAVENTELSQLIDEADEQFAKEKGLLEENYFENRQQDNNKELYNDTPGLNKSKNNGSKIDMSTQKVIPFPGVSHEPVKQPPFGQNRKLFSGMLLGAAFTTVTFLVMHTFCNSSLLSQKQENTTSKSSFQLKDIPVFPIKIDGSTSLFKSINPTLYKQNIFNQKNNSSLLDSHLNAVNDSKKKESIEKLLQKADFLENQQKQSEKMQRLSEKRQRLAESDQAFYEKRQQEAELRRSPEKAQQFRLQAQEYKAKAQLYRDKAQEYRNKAEQLLIVAHSYRTRFQELSMDIQNVSFSSDQ